MSLSVGIVGLPNVGKSTLFKALTKKEVDISNYPFCTIEPNIGIVSVPDERLEKLAELFHSEKVVPAVIKFVDIAGLVKGANIGEGLGNQFLSHIREVDAVVQVVRCFESPEIIHTEDKIDPLRDMGIINTELILKDLETAEKRLTRLSKELKAGDKEAAKEREILIKLHETLDGGELAVKYLRDNNPPSNEINLIKQLNFLTAKPIIYVFNSDKEPPQELLKEMAAKNFPWLVIDVKQEMENSEFSEREKMELGIRENLSDLIKKTYNILGLITFFTTGSDETRAWTIKAGVKAPQAAGTIHSDFEKKFIKAEVIEWNELIDAGGFPQAGKRGLLRIEGKDYIVKDGDAITVKHG